VDIIVCGDRMVPKFQSQLWILLKIVFLPKCIWLIKVSGIDSTIVLRYFDDVTLIHSLIGFFFFECNKIQHKSTTKQKDDMQIRGLSSHQQNRRGHKQSKSRH